MRRLLALLPVLILGSCTSTGVPATTEVSLPATTDPATTTTVVRSTTSTTPPTTAAILESLGGEPCPESDFTCVTLEMPLDHFDLSNNATIDVVFAVLPAEGRSGGAFLTLTGGPGSSGIASADSYTSLYDTAIAEKYDIVFFDPRGIAASGGFTCPVAATAYYRAEGDIHSAPGINRLVESASEFSADCVAEMGDPAELAYVSTAQVVEDIETFRETFGYDEFVVFGESYGTQVGQAYADAHGGMVDRLIIDGVVDLTLDTYEYHRQMAASSSNTLDLTLAGCDEDEWCAADMTGPAGEAYRRLAAELIEAPSVVGFPLPDGTVETRELTLGDLEVASSGALYEEYDRMLFNRALAAYAGRGDLVPMLRLAYVNLVVDPVTQEPVDDPSWSDAMYYAVECLDYAFAGETPEEKAEEIIAGADGIDGLSLGSTYYGDLPCAFWPHGTDEGRPTPLVAEGVPVLVLGSTVDPVTPYIQGVEVHSRLDDGYIMSKDGGPHVIFGWGETCPDEEVTAFILDGTPPETEMCEGVVVGDYVPLFPETPPEEADVLLDLVEWEVSYHPDYYYWDGYTDTSLGCYNQGTWSFASTDVGNDFTFHDCELAAGLVLDGTGHYDAEEDVFTLDVSIGECEHMYRRAGEDYSLDSSC
jgi:pimeloyl-ACP methyl ester carboxylesterase